MAPLLQFLLINGLGGFIAGLLAGGGYIVFYSDVELFIGQPLVIWN